MSDEQYMYRCLELAKLAAGSVAPNPMVGAVLVYKDCIIGEGFHKKFGEAHAEVNCINSVKETDKTLIGKSTLYVSLEPCAHYGKTPPCADFIIKNKILKVVIGCTDVYKEVAGKGIKKLEAAGIQLSVGILEKECLDLNKRFFTFQQQQRPYIILKWAQSIDGKIAGSSNTSGKKNPAYDGSSGSGAIIYQRLKISNEYTDRLVHRWRSEEAAILVGTNTARQDDPSLTTRLWQGKNPIRLIIDNNLRLPTSLKIFDKEVKTIIFNTRKHEEDGNTIFIKIDEENYLPKLVKELGKLDIQSVLIEGGARLIQSFADEGLWDEARVICNKTLVGGEGLSAPELRDHILEKQEEYSNDVVSYYRRRGIVKVL